MKRRAAIRLGKMLLSQKRHKNALPIYVFLTKLDTENSFFFKQRGICEMNLKMQAAAAISFRQANVFCPMQIAGEIIGGSNTAERVFNLGAFAILNQVAVFAILLRRNGGHMGAGFKLHVYFGIIGQNDLACQLGVYFLRWLNDIGGDGARDESLLDVGDETVLPRFFDLFKRGGEWLTFVGVNFGSGFAGNGDDDGE